MKHDDIRALIGRTPPPEWEISTLVLDDKTYSAIDIISQLLSELEAQQVKYKQLKLTLCDAVALIRNSIEEDEMSDACHIFLHSATAAIIDKDTPPKENE